MLNKKHNKKNRGASAKANPVNIVQSQSYMKALPVARKFDALLGIALLALINPVNNKQSQKQLLSVIRDLIAMKADLGLYGGVCCD